MKFSWLKNSRTRGQSRNSRKYYATKIWSYTVYLLSLLLLKINQYLKRTPRCWNTACPLMPVSWERLVCSPFSCSVLVSFYPGRGHTAMSALTAIKMTHLGKIILRQRGTFNRLLEGIYTTSHDWKSLLASRVLFLETYNGSLTMFDSLESRNSWQIKYGIPWAV